MPSRLTPTLTQEPGVTRSNDSADAGATLADAPTADATALGGRLGRYVVLRQIGQGGMGVVYSAYDELLARRVALKLVRTDTSGSAAHARILREAQALARLAHPNVVALYEVSAAAGQVFLAMEHVEGDTLRAWTAARRAAGADLRELLDMYIQAGRGLAAAHAAGLVHRDFKPDNVLVGTDGRARVVDFGLVAAPPPGEGVDVAAGRIEFTATGGLLGTPAYMSPEQFTGRGADARSDQFSFCVVVYEAVCGARPFAGDGVEELRAAVGAGVLRPPPPELPPWLWALLRRGLAMDPADRFASMDELLAGLAMDPVALRRRRRRVAGLLLLSALAAVIAALVVQGLYGSWLRRGHEQAAAGDLAVTEARLAEALAAGDRAAADRLFSAYVDDPLHEGTAALARAWLGQAARRESDGDRDDARSAFVAAYLAAPSEALQAESLVGLVRHFHDALRSDEFSGAFALLDRRHPDVARGADMAALRVDAALARRDLAGARQAAGDAPTRLLIDALRGATPTEHVSTHEIVVNGSHVLVVELRLDRRILHLTRKDPALTRIRTIVPPEDTKWVTPVDTDPFLVALAGEVRNSLVRVDEDGMTPLYDWPRDAPLAMAATDLDGDGVREVYVGQGAGGGILEFKQDGRGEWSDALVYTETDTMRSAVDGMVALDLDGDGRDELVAAFGGWRAYDVRVLQRAPGSDRLHMVGRDKLGPSVSVSSMRGASGEPMVVVNHIDHGRSTLVFPPEQPYGAPEGLYAYTFDGAGLHRRAHLSHPAGATHWNHRAADVDGDGRDDLAVRRLESVYDHTLLHLQRADGGFTRVQIGQLGFRGFAQLDDDPMLELLAEVDEGGVSPRLWVIGAGDGEVPPVTDTPSEEVAIVDPDDAVWTRQASRAAALAELGLHTDAAEALRGLARRSPRPELRGRAFLRAATLYERGERDRDAVDLYRAAAALPAVAAEALQGLLRTQLRVGDYDDAGETVAALLALRDLADDERAGLTRRYGQLPREVARRIDLDFSQPLAPQWDLADARALQREPDGLVISTGVPGVLMSLPVTLSGDLLELHADVSLRQLEWNNFLEIGLVPEDAATDEPLVKVQVKTSGTSRGGSDVLRFYTCEVGRQYLGDEGPAGVMPVGDEPVRAVMRVAFTPALGEVGCEIRRHDVPHGRHNRRRDIPLPPAGRYRLVVRLIQEVPAWLEVRLHRISLRGATIRDEPGDPARRGLQRAVVARDAVATLAAFADRRDPTKRERVWQADALLQLGRRGEADAVWTELLAADPLDADLVARLRGEPTTYGPLLHALDPAGHVARLAAVWRNTAANHLHDPRAREAMAAALAPLDVEASRAAASDDAGRGAVADLLGWRGRLWARAGETARARADLERVLAIVAALGDEAPQRSLAWMQWIELATLAAGEDDPARAREAIRRARETSNMPLLVDDIVRARASLAALAGP